MHRERIFLSVLILLALACNVTSQVTPTQTGPEVGEPAASPTVDQPAVLRIVYTDNVNGFQGSNLWIIDGSAPPRQLTSSGQDSTPLLSDDGSIVAFRRSIDPHTGADELWVVNSDGSNERSLISQAWLSNVKAGDTGSTFRAEWAPGTHLLAFSTRAASEWPGLVAHQNLYLVNVDNGDITPVLPPDSNAVLFFYSPDGRQIALTSSSTVSLINADGSGRRDVLSYQAIGRGEGSYIVRVDWSPDGTYLRAAIPSEDPLVAEDTLWHIPANGDPAYVLAALSGTFPYISPEIPLFAPDLGHVPFFRPVGDPSANVRELHIAGGDGSGDSIYVSGQPIQWWGWAPDSRRFIYELEGAAYLGEIGASPRPLFTDVSKVFWPRWASNDQVIFFSGASDAWQLRLGTPGGSSVLLASPSGDMAQFDFSR